ncbi:rhodanese-like domain-containing protein [Traorella massiliensis]|uniref:rhodanese-like domain-containing protein n=1 Tax=Traorella massiliensis TaxID=1903263 RepID=UPI0023561816|nr:rhodanese-like domain-containing protein [Traorella massiliensis]
MKKGDPIEYTDEHQSGKEIFNEVFMMQYTSKKAKYEWNMFLYVQLLFLLIAMILNYFFTSYMPYILTVTIVLFIICYYLNTKKRREMLVQGKIKKVRLTNAQRGVDGFMTIKPATAYEIMKEDCLIIEVSVREYYDEMHVVGAVSIPLEVLSEKIDEMNLNPNKTILVYGRAEEKSKQGAQLLVDKGFKDVYEFGSIMDWPFDVVLQEENETSL